MNQNLICDYEYAKNETIEDVLKYLVTSPSIFYSYQPLVPLTMACRARFTSSLPGKLHRGTWRPSGPAMLKRECLIFFLEWECA